MKENNIGKLKDVKSSLIQPIILITNNKPDKTDRYLTHLAYIMSMSLISSLTR